MTRNLKLSLIAAALLSTALTACGGGGGNDDSIISDVKAVTTEVINCPFTGNTSENVTKDGSLTVAQANDANGFKVRAAAVSLGGASKDEDLKWTWKPTSAAGALTATDAKSDKDFAHEATINAAGVTFKAGDVITVDVHVDRNSHEDTQHGNSSCKLTVK